MHLLTAVSIVATVVLGARSHFYFRSSLEYLGIYYSGSYWCRKSPQFSHRKLTAPFCCSRGWVGNRKKSFYFLQVKEDSKQFLLPSIQLPTDHLPVLRIPDTRPKIQRWDRSKGKPFEAVRESRELGRAIWKILYTRLSKEVNIQDPTL